MAVVQSSGKLQRSSVTGAQTFTNALPGNTTPGNSAIVTIVHYGSGVPNTRITGVTVGGTAGVKDSEKLDSGNINAVEIWRVSNMASASRDVVITLPGASGQFVTAGVEEWDNITTSSPLDQTGSGGPTAGSTAPSVTSGASTTQASEVVYAAFCDYTGTNWTSSTPPAGYTESWEEPNGAAQEAGSAAYQIVSSTGSQTATFTTGASMSWIAAMATYKLTGGGATPTISTTSTATPAYGGSLTITGTNFEASQGTGSVTIGGVAQTVTSWSDTSITVSVGRGANKYGAALNLVVANNSGLSSSPYALTGLLPQTGWSYVDIGTPNTTAANRITSVPDLASGDQVAYSTQGGQVVVANDGTFSVSTGVRSFDFEVWTSPDGWGGQATQYVRADVADTRLKKQRMRSSVTRWMYSGAGGEKLTQRGWFSRDIVLPVAASGGAAALQASVAGLVTVTPALSTQIRLAASASGQVTVTAALTTQIPLAAAPAAVATVAAALTTQVRLAAAPAAQVTVSAALTTGIPLAASAQSVVTLTAALASNAAALQSAVQGQTTVTAALSTGIPLAAAPQSVCTVAAALATGIPLAASAQGVTTVTAALAGTAAPLQASAQSQTTVTADLSTQIRLQAAVANVATLGAQLSTGIQLAAAASSSCTITAALTTAIRLQASVQAVVTASATLAGTAAALQASVQSQASVSAALTVAKPLACVVIAQAQVSAALTTRIALQAIAQAQTTATAALTTQQSYEAAVLCSVTVVAAFQVYPGARASAPGVQLARSGGQSLRRPAVVALRRK